LNVRGEKDASREGGDCGEKSTARLDFLSQEVTERVASETNYAPNFSSLTDKSRNKKRSKK
jgi:hypothetical protein